MALDASKKHCANHPERPGYALCMACRKTVCQECATTFDGINYCVACLAARRKDPGKTWSAPGWFATAAAAALLFYLTGQLMVWALVLYANRAVW